MLFSLSSKGLTTDLTKVNRGEGMWGKRSVMLLSMVGVLLLTACGGAEDCYDCYSEPEPGPELYAFEMVDTYATNSEFESEPLAISPYVNGGEFEVFWDLWSRGDYIVSLYVNSTNSHFGSVEVSTDWCSYSSQCHDYQYQYCHYSSDFYLGCEISSGGIHEAYIGDLISFVPQTLYFILEACDPEGYSCQSYSLPVRME